MSKKIRKFMADSEVYYNERVDHEIERNRKGNFEIVLKNKKGETLTGEYKVEVELDRIDFNFGSSMFMLDEYDDEERNTKYKEKFVNIFNSATIPLYWEGTEPTEGYLRYDASTPHDIYRRPPADCVAKFCDDNKLEMKGHPLFWHHFIPNWLPDNYQELKKLIVKRFKEISERYADRVPVFDVVNEPSRVYIAYMKLRRNGHKVVVPEKDYCVWLFRLARQYFPANKLILNDTVGASFEEFRGRFSGFYLTVKDLLNQGIEVDEIGMQCHCDENGPENVYDSERFYNILDTYAELGKTINISEISIPSKFDGVEDQECQAEAAVRLYKAAFSHPAVTGLTWWNMPDDGVLTSKDSIAGENLLSTGLIDSAYNEKLAYKELQKLIKEEWTTKASADITDGIMKFRGFYGKYKVRITGKEFDKTFEMDFGKNSPKVLKLMVE